MIVFIVIGTVMLASALWLLLWPLLTRSTRTTIPRRELNVGIAQQRLAEITTELENEQLSDADFNTAQTDLEDSLLTDIELEEQVRTPEEVRAYTGVHCRYLVSDLGNCTVFDPRINKLPLS